METVKINFNLPKELADRVDEEAQYDHRDRTSMLTKIIATYYENKPRTNHKKKAGTR